MSATELATSGSDTERRAVATRSRAVAPIATIAVMAAILTAVSVLSTSSTIYWMVDFLVYRAGGSAVVHGVPLYEMTVHTPAFANMQFTYTPFAALLFVPMSLAGSAITGTLWLFVNFLALGAVIWVALRTVGKLPLTHMIALTVVGMAVASRLDPVWSNNQNGQINMIVMLLVLLDFSPLLPRRYRGIATGIAAAIKLTPLIFVAYLLLTRRGREALRACLTFVASIGLAFLILPASSASYWFGGLFLDSHRVVSVSNVVINDALSGLFARLAHTEVAPHWTMVLSALVGILGLAGAVWAHRRGQDAIGLLVAAFAGLIASPVSWPHHFVWIVPALIWLGFAAWRTRRALPMLAIAGVLAFFLNPFYPAIQQAGGNGQPLQWTPAGEVIATVGGYLTITLLALVLLPLWLPRLLPRR